MKIFYTFLVMLVTAFLFMLPVNQGVYNFLTFVKTDTAYVATAGLTTANVTLAESLFNGDLNTVSFFSNLATDTPQTVSYNTANHVLDIAGLTTSSNRSLQITYDTSSFGTGLPGSAIAQAVSYTPWLWYVMLSIIPILAIVVLWRK